MTITHPGCPEIGRLSFACKRLFLDACRLTEAGWRGLRWAREGLAIEAVSVEVNIGELRSSSVSAPSPHCKK